MNGREYDAHYVMKLYVCRDIVDFSLFRKMFDFPLFHSSIFKEPLQSNGID